MSSAEPSSRPRRGRPPLISADDIHEAVLRHRDSDWSVTTIADDLGVSNPAIYHYFPSKRAIIAAVGERLMLEQPVPVFEGDWRQLLTSIATSWYETFVKFPPFLDIDTAGAAGSSHTRALISERSLVEMLKAGFAAPDAIAVTAAMASVARESAAIAVMLSRGDQAPALLDAETFPALASALPQLEDAAVESYFERALGVVLDGAGTRLPKTAKRRA